jgi:hypothetical protein
MEEENNATERQKFLSEYHTTQELEAIYRIANNLVSRLSRYKTHQDLMHSPLSKQKQQALRALKILEERNKETNGLGYFSSQDFGLIGIATPKNRQRVLERMCELEPELKLYYQGKWNDRRMRVFATKNKAALEGLDISPFELKRQKEAEETEREKAITNEICNNLRKEWEEKILEFPDNYLGFKEYFNQLKADNPHPGVLKELRRIENVHKKRYELGKWPEVVEQIRRQRNFQAGIK